MAHNRSNGPANVSQNGNDPPVERVDGWPPNYMTLRENAVTFTPEETSPPPKVIPDRHVRPLNLRCVKCEKTLRAHIVLTRQQELDIRAKWNQYHSHSNDDST